MPGKKKDGQDTLLDLTRGSGVVVEVVSESWHFQGSLQDKKVLGKHSVILHSLFQRSHVFNFYLMTLGMAELWDLRGSQPDINMNNSSDSNSPEGEDKNHLRLQKSLAGLLQCFQTEGREE